MKFYQLCDLCLDDNIWNGLKLSPFAAYANVEEEVSKIRVGRFLTAFTDEEMSFLHQEAPEDLVAFMLKQCKRNYFLTKSGQLRVTRLKMDEEEVSTFDAYLRFGSTAIIEALEFGSYQLR
jgi:hypothetical protein